MKHRKIGARRLFSTARRVKVTPTGTFRPQCLKRCHYSKLCINALKPWWTFYSGNSAIHGTQHVKRLGRPVSVRCVRLSPGNAWTVYRMVQQVGREATRIRPKN